MSSALQRRFGVSAALAVIAAEVMGGGIFLPPRATGWRRSWSDTGPRAVVG
jgi:hypothetical protein